MKVPTKQSVLVFAACLLAAGLVACAKSESKTTTSESGGGGTSTGSSYTGATVKGVVQPASTALATLMPSAFGPRHAATAPMAGCTVTAKNIDTGAVVATATTDSSGVYVIDKLTAGVNYEIVADCSGQKFTTYANADTVDPSSTTKQVDTVDARSTVVAAYISKAIKKAVSDALADSTLPPAVKSAIKDAIFGAIDEVIAQMRAEITAAIDSGQIQVDDTLADALAEQQDSAAGAETAFTTDPDTLLTASGNDSTVVSSAVEGSAAFMALLTACQTTVNSQSTGATVNTCVQKLAQTLYGLKETVVLILDLGAFGAQLNATACTTAGVDALGFPEANTKTMPAPNNPSVQLCVIEPRQKAFDRNDPTGENSRNSGGGGGPTWHEGPGGIVRAMAHSLIAGQRYTFADLNNFIVGNQTVAATPSAKQAGMNMRFFAQDTLANDYYYQDASGQWRRFPPNPFCDFCGSMTPWDLRGSIDANWAVIDANTNGKPDGLEDPRFANVDATTMTNIVQFVSALSAAYGAGASASAPTIGDYFTSQFNGLTKEQVKDLLAQKRIHIEGNPSGPREFRVVYTVEPNFGDVFDAKGNFVSQSPCNDNDETTPCLGIDGSVQPVLRATASKDTSGVITALTKSATGTILFEPVSGPQGDTTAFRLLSEETVNSAVVTRYLRDRYGRPLEIYAVTQGDIDNNTSVCADPPADPFTVPTPTTTCGLTAGDVYMVREIWDCSQQCKVNFVRVSTTAIAVTGIVIKDLTRIEFETTRVQINDHDLQVLGQHNDQGGSPFKFDLANDGSNGPKLTENTDTGAWYAAPLLTCNMGGCVRIGFGFYATADGAPLDANNADTALAAIGVNAFSAAALNDLGSPLIPDGSVDCRGLQQFHDAVDSTASPAVKADLQYLLDQLTGAKCNADPPTANPVPTPWWRLPGLIFAEEQVTMMQPSPSGPTMMTDKRWVPKPRIRKVQFSAIGGTSVTAYVQTMTLAQAVQRRRIFSGPYRNQSWQMAEVPFFLDLNGNGVVDVGEPTFDNQWDLQQQVQQYVCMQLRQQDPSAMCQGDTTGAFQTAVDDAMGKVTFALNGFAFGNDVVAGKLMNTAFSFQSGTLSLSESTQFNAMQGFAVLFLYFQDAAGTVLADAPVLDASGNADGTRTLRVSAQQLADQFDQNENISTAICTFRVADVGTDDGCPYPFP